MCVIVNLKYLHNKVIMTLCRGFPQSYGTWVLLHCRTSVLPRPFYLYHWVCYLQSTVYVVNGSSRFKVGWHFTRERTQNLSKYVTLYVPGYSSSTTTLIDRVENWYCNWTKIQEYVWADYRLSTFPIVNLV